ncbi:hypothetical protein LEP1GSC127_0022 [Leptospira kirschneri str. 200801925]|nr:hypothetical protein LEP1GSC127_0022 [Leptospira kirschneri str. 200801925]
MEKEKTRILKSPVLRDLIVNGNAINNSSVVVRKSVLDVVGSLDETPDLIAGEDYDYWLRIAKITDRFYRIPRTLGYYWTGGGNLTNPIRSLNILRTLQKNINRILIDTFRIVVKLRGGFIKLDSWSIYL